jgi:hypothetical protein
MNDKQTAKLEGVPALYKKVVIRAYQGSSRSAAIKAFCLDCVGYVRADITNCTAGGCPLHPYRPYQAGSTEAEDSVEPSENEGA